MNSSLLRRKKRTPESETYSEEPLSMQAVHKIQGSLQVWPQGHFGSGYPCPVTGSKDAQDEATSYGSLSPTLQFLSSREKAKVIRNLLVKDDLQLKSTVLSFSSCGLLFRQYFPASHEMLIDKQYSRHKECLRTINQ